MDISPLTHEMPDMKCHVEFGFIALVSIRWVLGG